MAEVPLKKRKVECPQVTEENPPPSLEFGGYQYQQGWGAHLSSEADPGALPKIQNSPQQCPNGLYGEKLSGTSFTTPTAHNKQLWLYRLRPSANHGRYQECGPHAAVAPWDVATPERMRWKPFPAATAEEGKTFIDGLVCYGGAGDAATQQGMAIYMYTANRPMVNCAFFTSDGDFLLVPEKGDHDIITEAGRLSLAPSEIAIIPRGMKFRVSPRTEGEVLRGYACESFEGNFVIPDRGPIGADGLASARHFKVPTAWYEDVDTPEGGFTVYHKFNRSMWKYGQNHSCFDVVAWHGSYVPVKYDTRLFCAVNTVTFDHMDPSIFTVLTSQTTKPGVAAVDFVVFPPRWSVGENTFRPPYYHRNCMSEFMGMVVGNYEAKKGFQCGGASLHSCMSAHGPEKAVYEGASKAPSVPERVADGSIAFMLESTYVMNLTQYAAACHEVDSDYYQCWNGLDKKYVKPAVVADS